MLAVLIFSARQHKHQREWCPPNRVAKVIRSARRHTQTPPHESRSARTRERTLHEQENVSPSSFERGTRGIFGRIRDMPSFSIASRYTPRVIDPMQLTLFRNSAYIQHPLFASRRLIGACAESKRRIGCAASAEHDTKCSGIKAMLLYAGKVVALRVPYV